MVLGETRVQPSKLRQRWATGLILGAFATIWLFSGNGPFMLGLCVASVLAQLEYYHMVQNTGVQPALKTGIISSILCYVCAAQFPLYHEMVLPVSATMVMTWLLLMQKKPATINEISTTFLGMFYVGYMPSFWVRLRALGVMEPTRFPALMRAIPWAPPADAWTLGAVVTWWTWISIVCADVGAYFVGKSFGRIKLSAVSSAAGAASPRKTVEGAIGGLFCCTLMSVLGAWLMAWPLWFVTGTAYGIMLSVIALVGDLTASMFKRDAGVKDSGQILPGHGGLLDRVDSYMFTAPCAYIFCVWLLPFARKVSSMLP
jgi:CDP-diglyceride synthetase